MTNKQKPKLTANMRKVKKLLNDIPDDRKPIALELFDELLFMENTLTKLKEQINNEGAVDTFKQGKQEFLREHPALKAYYSLVTKYSQYYKQLIELLPTESHEQASDPLIDFVEGSK